MEEIAEARVLQIQRVLESRAFRNTDVLKRLLDYLGKQALEGQASDLKEYTVGVEAFGRPAGYDPKTDSSVRVQAGKLRQKLDEYYRTEGLTDPIVIELPKGHFTLEFREKYGAPVVAAKPDRWRMLAGLLGVLLLVAIACSLYLGSQARRPDLAKGIWNAEMEELWKPFLDTQRPLMVVLGTPLFTKLDNAFFRDPAVNTWEAAGKSDRVKELQRIMGDDTPSAAYSYTGVGEAAGAFGLARLFLVRGRDLTFQVSSVLTWEDIGRNNMIFLGPPKYISQTKDLPIEQDFRIEHSRVQSLRPRDGEPKVFPEKWSADGSNLEEGHALITRMPGLHNTGEVMILGGSSTECTRAAVDYVTRPEYAARLVRSLRKETGAMPASFQVVIRAQFKSHMPIAIDQVALHVLK
jgi:hypothetical protein